MQLQQVISGFCRCSIINFFFQSRYVPNKTLRYGIKIHALCDSKSGYVNNIEVDCGTQSSLGPYFVSNHPKDVIYRLVNHLEHSGRSVTAGIISEAYQISKMLLERGITFTGTLKNKQKEIPVTFMKQNNIGEVIYGFQKDCTLLSYAPENNKTSKLLSTKFKEISNKGKEKMVQHYESTVNVVNSVDDLISKTYTTVRRTRNWAHVLFYTLLNIAGYNAYILYTSNPANKKCDLKQFLKNLGISLMNDRLRERASLKMVPSEVQHFLSKYRVPDPETSGMELEQRRFRKRGRCKPCGRRSDSHTTSKCEQCFNFICKRHSTLLCNDCLQGLYLESPNEIYI